jgi:hypothetical protein
MGLAPGTPSGTWIQKVPLIGTRSRGTIAFSSGGKTLNAASGQDFVVWSNLPEPQIEVKDSGLVFVGYGVVAPEYGWNDYAGVEVTGKTVVVLTGDRRWRPCESGEADPALSGDAPPSTDARVPSRTRHQHAARRGPNRQRRAGRRRPQSRTTRAKT